MSKEHLNLSIEKSLKKRAKKIAKQKGMSVSRFFEKLIAREKDPEAFTPPPGSGTAQFVNAVTESGKMEDYDYKTSKKEMLEERYGDK